ncbi:hypothetical protein YB2330_005973 [Saitoella coloradoensis]
MQYLIFFAHVHEHFRLPELDALAKLEGIDVDLTAYTDSSPFLVVDLPDEETARRLVKRAVLVRAIYELWGEAPTLDALHDVVKTRAAEYGWFEAYRTDTFKYEVEIFNHTRPVEEHVEMINSFRFTGFEGRIRMKGAQQIYAIFEEWTKPKAGPHTIDPTHKLVRVFKGRLVSVGNREAIHMYDLKKRQYLGTTSMDAELSLVSANMAHATPGKLVYDPFVGTGSFLFTCGHYGAMTFGSDIDGRQIRGGGKKRAGGVLANIKQYGLSSHFLDCCTYDITHNPLRKGVRFDAIVCDPPYGVRAGAKKLGRKNDEELRTEPILLRTGIYSHEQPDYHPPMKPYELSEVMVDLLGFSATRLNDGGRLVLWLPTVTDEYQDVDIPTHPNMTLLYNSVQDFGKWARRLLTYVRHVRKDGEEVGKEGVITNGLKPAHADFREKYFNRFRKDPEAGEVEEVADRLEGQTLN